LIDQTDDAPSTSKSADLPESDVLAFVEFEDEIQMKIAMWPTIQHKIWQA
jgi:hypothetical protein